MKFRYEQAQLRVQKRRDKIAVMVWIIGWVIWATVFRGNTTDDNLMVFLWLFAMGGLIWMAGGFENVSIGFPQGTE
jgi:hypothetical protein